MEHYLLCILNSSLTEKDHSLVKKYLQSLFPNPLQNYHIKKFNESVSALLKAVSKYVVILNVCKANENPTWKSLNEDVNVLDAIKDATTKTDSAFDYNSQDTIDDVCESLHSLADQLPAFGTYKLDILLGSDVLRELSVRKESSLAGAFIRLTRWHSAHFTIFGQQEFDQDRLNEWLEITDGEILHLDRKCELGPSLWRGSIQFLSADNKKETYRGFQLKLEGNENETDTCSAVKGDSYLQRFVHTVLSSKLQLFDEVSFVSIPKYLITPITFRLHLSKLHVLNANSSNFLEYLLNNKTVAFIAKIGYSELKEKSKPERKYTSRAWEKAASFGDVKDSECFVTSFDKFITFVITKSHYSNCVVAYPLRDPANLNANFYFTLLNHRICNARHFVPQDTSKSEACTGGDHKHRNILDKYLKCNMDLKNSYCNCKDIDFSFLNVKNSNSSAHLQFNKSCLSKFSVEQLDPSDWPERIQLLQKQMKNGEDGDGFLTNASVHNLKFPHQSYSLSSQTIREHFLASGEAKHSVNRENIYQNSNSHYVVNHSLNDVLQVKWPEIRNCIYHDLYYNNSDQIEDKENLGSQLAHLYVQHETACTCNNQQVIQNSQITVSERIQSPSKAFRGPSSRLPIISNENRETSPSPRKSNLKNLITKKILSTSTLQLKNFEETRKTIKETTKKIHVNKNPVPVRCSPRKKNPVSYKYPSVNRNNENKNAELNKMPDLLRKKLRYAVAKALEDNGINSSHKLYQSCGAKLFAICRTFLDDLKLKKGKTSEYLQKIADAHVKQVIEFYKE